MITKRIIPCLDVKDGRVVKGVNFLNLGDVASPVELAKYYSDHGADELVFYDITASAEGRALFTDILTETAHVRGQRLVGVILGQISGNVTVELRGNPVIHAAHIIDEPRSARIRAACKPQCQRHIAIQLERAAGIKTDDEKIKSLFFKSLFVFGEQFQLGAAPKIRV